MRGRALAVVIVPMLLAAGLPGCLTFAEDEERPLRVGDFAVVRMTAFAFATDEGEPAAAYAFTEDGLAPLDADGLPATSRAPRVTVLAGPAVPRDLPAEVEGTPFHVLPAALTQHLYGAVAGLTYRPPLAAPDLLYGEPDPGAVVTYPLVETVPRDPDASPGDVVELPAYWSDTGAMWRSRVVDTTSDGMRVRHLPEEGRTFRAGTDVARIVAVTEGEGIRVDYNHPLAGRHVLFNVTMERVVPVPDGGRDPATPLRLTLLDGNATTHPVPGEATLLYFTATWCAVCKEQMPHVRAFAATAPDVTVVVVGVDPTETAEDLDAYRRKHAGDEEPPWTWTRDTENRALHVYGAGALPRLVLVDAGMDVVFARTGVVTDERLHAEAARARAVPAGD